MQYDGLDQTGKALVTPLLSSQGRVMVGKCDEIGGPYLQVMSETLIDGIEKSFLPLFWQATEILRCTQNVI